MDNLKSILENGFLSVELQSIKSIKGKTNDKVRFDSKLNTTSFSISFPNYKMFYSLKIKDRASRWVIITLNPNILYLHKENIYYCENNAASKEITMKDGGRLKTPLAFEDIFKENMDTKYYGKICRSNLNIPINYSTDPQAEILIEGHIGIENIRSIYFGNNENYDFARDNMWDLIKNYNIDIVNKYFAPRNDYLYWKKGV